MKKYGAVIALGIAILFGFGAVFLANKWMASQTTETQILLKDTLPLTKIVIAAKDLSIGTPLTEENITLADWPKANVPRGAFENYEDVLGRITVSPMAAGKPLLNAELAAPGSGVGLVAMIKPGKRAMAIQVDEVIGVGGFVLPHTFVDVISIKSPNRDKHKVAKTILEKIEVLAIAQETFIDEGKAKLVRTVTLELEPLQAEKLALATNEGTIQLALRNPLDMEAPEEKPQVAAVVKKRPVPSLKARVFTPQPSPHGVEVIRGASPPEKVEFKNVDSEERI